MSTPLEFDERLGMQPRSSFWVTLLVIALAGFLAGAAWWWV